MATKKTVKVKSKKNKQFKLDAYQQLAVDAEHAKKINQMAKSIKAEERILRKARDEASRQESLEKELGQKVSAEKQKNLEPKDEQLRRAIQTENWIHQRVQEFFDTK